MRSDGRSADHIRQVKITPDFISQAEGSVLIELGKTRASHRRRLHDILKPQRRFRPRRTRRNQQREQRPYITAARRFLHERHLAAIAQRRAGLA